ncbi:16S rRNA (guanine(527)-N(7))-methyltransferase RsmG [Allonocardiopsis opalescens]|uniref:16S rRNA (guanine(527)-N(7))-methyltransferase RsmG n=1 Tax=Allonocardiopsis opalescens TaxID=1144618 RepID=UPI001FEA527B|nr:16S rRNA (guanine(527)-N(7))-methyltransferase RsmG [Allonocardiopsis opalescens]
MFGSRLPLAERYAALLADAGVQRGLIGPREVDRIWTRHILNCAVVEELVPHGAHVVDIGSGAGLPGIVLAIARPDLTVTLLEPLLRRTVFLNECLELLGLDRVVVERGRAEEFAARLRADVVTARAVAPLDRLARWALPLLKPDGRLLALKGERAADELETARREFPALRSCQAEVVPVGHGMVDPATTVVQVIATGSAVSRETARRSAGATKQRGRKR